MRASVIPLQRPSTENEGPSPLQLERTMWIFYSRTFTVTNSSVDNWPSLARTRSRYSPGSVKVILDVAVPFSTSAKYGSVVMFAGPRQTS